MQEQLSKNSKEETKSPLEAGLESIGPQIQVPKTKRVKLKYWVRSFCGCSDGYYQELEREVSFDSELEDGDITDEWLDGDKEID